MTSIRHRWPVAWLAAFLLYILTGPAMAFDTIEGYLNARLGMTVAEVKATFPNDGITILAEGMAEGDPMIQAKRREGDDPLVLVYGFTGEEPRLAIINVFYPNRAQEDDLLTTWNERLGPPLSKEATAESLKALQKDFPEPITALSLWASLGGEKGRHLRIARFQATMLVQYYDSGLMALAK